MGKPRNYCRYLFKVGPKIVHGGITKDLDRREGEHLQKWPQGHILQQGPKVSEDTARKWEEERGFS